ncbi:LysR family transcriptional regulator [Kitasatospora sp. NPDC052896]|uniref:LysR family transcriptional regulator n=1 Tax=Kitasatospora sp. NPDC052896 TaxID=3364061 RepID=UPI0037C55FB5
MELRQLEYFLAVAEERSFSRGARRVHIVQSAVSAAIARLERDLDVDLFDRTGRRIALTPAGEALLPQARATLEAARRARDSVAAVRGALNGNVVMGTPLTTGPLDLPAVLGRFHAAHPGVALQLRPPGAGSVGHLAAVADGVLDLALVSLPDPGHPGVELDPLLVEPLLLVCRADHALATRVPGAGAALDALAGEPFIDFAPGWGSRAATDRAFAAARLRRRVAFEVADYGTAAGLIEHRFGVALMPATAARRTGLHTVPVADPLLTWTLSLARRAPSRTSPAALALAAAIRAEVRREPA